MADIAIALETPSVNVRTGLDTDLQATPFVKWVGGKRALVPDIKKYFPEKIETYWEPFVGGGAVFFAMADRIEHAVLSDLNEELVTTYNVIKTQVDDLIEVLRIHECEHKEDDGYYLHVRACEPKNALDIAARFIYLNKTCYNGLYRVNRSGKFNVPKGRYKNPGICNEDNLRAVSTVLSKAEIVQGNFENIVYPESGDFIYCDPPYDDCFTNYQAGGFTVDDQMRLRDTINAWVDAKANVMLSNSNTPLIRKLYKKGWADQFTLHKVKAPRFINSRASGRGNVSELIIISYG